MIHSMLGFELLYLEEYFISLLVLKSPSSTRNMQFHMPVIAYKARKSRTNESLISFITETQVKLNYHQ